MAVGSRACMERGHYREECPYEDHGFMEAYGKGEVGDATDWFRLVATHVVSTVREGVTTCLEKEKWEEWPVLEASEGGAACLSAGERAAACPRARGGGQLGQLPQRSWGLKLVPRLREGGPLKVNCPLPLRCNYQNRRQTTSTTALTTTDPGSQTPGIGVQTLGRWV
ncbi:UNVERIFIED_CONTAM: hypothetical protein FKN15_000268 [Acipenser sinensis]